MDAPSSYLLQCAPGLNKILQKELCYFGAIAKDEKVFLKLQRNHDLLFFNRVKDPDLLAQSRMAEVILRCPAYGKFKISKRQLDTMAAEMKALGRRRLVVTVAGRRFQRHDLLRWLNGEMASREYNFSLNEDDPEVWMFCIDDAWYFGIPLHKARKERAAERPGSLPPTIAAAMAFVSHPREGEVVCDPTCGSGTLLAEFHGYEPKSRLIGYDIDPDAIGAARKNLKGISGFELSCVDSRALKAEKADISLMLANLPFGIQYGEKSTNPELYTAILREMLRLRNPEKNWRAIILTSDVVSLQTATTHLGALTSELLFKVKIRGELASVFRLKINARAQTA